MHRMEEYPENSKILEILIQTVTWNTPVLYSPTWWSLNPGPGWALA